MQNIVKITVNGKTEYWFNVTEYVKGMMGSDVKDVEVLLITGENKDTIAEAIAKSIVNDIAEKDNLEITCECMKITFKNDKIIEIKNR